MDAEGAALWIFLLLALAWLVVLVTSIIGLVNRDDMRLPAKIFWGVVICLAPVVGLIIYLVLNRRRKAEDRAVQK